MLSVRSKIIFVLVLVVVCLTVWFFARSDEKLPSPKPRLETPQETSDQLVVVGGDLEAAQDGEKITIKLNGKIYTAEIARTPESRSLGLSGRSSLDENEALLFIFDEPGYPSFWMKDMKFAIDIIWLDENLRVVDITKNATPDSYPQTFQPKSPAQYVLEIKSN